MATVRISNMASSFQHVEHSMELNSHADTCVVGQHCLVTHKYDKRVNVSGYDPNLGSMKGMEIVSAALTYNDPMAKETVILRIHQGVHIPSMTNNLLCPMQLRLNDVQVNDCPKFLHPNPDDTTHTIVVHEQDDTLIIPLSLSGVTSYFPTRKPTDHENVSCRSFNLTFEDPTWDPSDDTFKKQEEAQVDSKGRVHEPGDHPDRYFISTLSANGSQTPSFFDSQCAAVLMDIEPSLDEYTFAEMLKANVCLGSTTTSRRKGLLSAEKLARN